MAICCPKTFTGFCLDDQTPIAITIDNGVLVSWTNLVTGVVTPGNPPAGTGVCEVPSTITVEVEIPPVTFDPLTCVKDAVTVCQGTTPWEVTGNIVIEPTNLDCLTDSVTVCQGTDPWTIDGTVALDAPTLAALETITVNQGTSPWVVSGTVSVTEPVTVDGTVALDAATLAALETITVNQGTSPWVVSSVALDCATDSVTICPGLDPIVVSGTVELGAITLAALETVTVLQGTSPWVVSGTVSVTEPVTVDAVDFDIRNLDCATDSITICPPVSGTFNVEVINTIDIGSLTCETDSITVCPPVSGVFEVSDDNIPDLTGTWDYVAGISGTEIIVGRVLSITAVATALTGGSMVIDGGDTITLPSGIPISIAPGAQLINPTITFTSTASYFVEFLT